MLERRLGYLRQKGCVRLAALGSSQDVHSRTHPQLGGVGGGGEPGRGGCRRREGANERTVDRRPERNDIRKMVDRFSRFYEDRHFLVITLVDIRTLGNLTSIAQQAWDRH
ncbi:uncharacterized protein LOC119467964 [Cebus imitator]|uniref:uncharacterized protein LOC119467964 n=1 Tax=Cebus imitator TaxID=2715852 RepID=UPI00189C5846|nr:uncharacterized protein LOC119467964 [Cebus imitator]